MLNPDFSQDAALIVAAGAGGRAGAGEPKQFISLCGKSLLRRCVEQFVAAGFGQVLVVVDNSQQHRAVSQLEGLNCAFTSGGASRTASVRAGIEALAARPPRHVYVHDAARPGLNAAILARLQEALTQVAAAAPALPPVDALKRVDAALNVIEDAPREAIWRVQTPQAFHYAAFARAMRAAPPEESFDDDLALARAAGLSARLVLGDIRLMKITYPEDFAVAERLLAGPRVSVSSQGFDAHAFGPGDHVTLCGLAIPHTHGMEGHSDSDVAWHALTDALLGAVASADIGEHFDPSDPQWKGADSAIFLRRAAELVAQAGGRIAHVDLTLICERPRVKPHRNAMRARTAEVLGLPLSRVSVKATTTEGMGFTGRQEGIAAMASATVLLPEHDDA